MAKMTRVRRTALRSNGLALCAVAAILLAGCAAESQQQNSGSGDVVEQPVQAEAETSGEVTAEDIAAGVEAEGLVCAEDEPHSDAQDQVIVCKGDDYVIITATHLVDAGLVPELTANAKDAVCKSDLDIDGTRFAVSGAWIIAPGGGDDKNIAAFDAAMNTLGLEWSLDAC